MLAHDRQGKACSMQIRVLGHFEASVDDRPVAVGGPKQRAVLAMLGLEANRTVTTDRLIAGLWGDRPPASAAKMLQNYVWRLRGLLADGGPEILTHGRAYELRIDPELLDIGRLERLLGDAGRPGNAAREALALFRGDPLADLADEPFAAAEIRRLEELRLTAAELAIDADLAAGRHQEIVGEVNALLAQNPLRERLHAQRMLALYRCGRQAEALEAYRDARRTLVEEIGIEPGPELRRLHDAILRQDPALDVEAEVAELPRELDAAASPPLAGRDGEMRRLRTRWRRVAGGAGALVTVVGGYGMGKTRIAAELAADAHGEGAVVVYAAGTRAPEVALAAIARARDSRAPALLVLDDVDRATADVHAALRELGRALPGLPVLVLATGQEAAALARLDPRESVELEPLDTEAVRLIAGFYAPAGAGDGVPLETLLARSRGVARRVHEAASEWARQEATRRVDAVAGRAAVGRRDARALEAELAGSVVELVSARERAALVGREGDAAEAPVICPYKGLATFDADDAAYFFGREHLVADLVAGLVGAPLLGVVGPSGSGKSSVVRAGLLPAIAGGVLPGSERWARVLIRPGEHPLRELHRSGVQSRDERRLVLVVDQFEELFTACEDQAARAQFIGALVRAASDSDGGRVVVLAMRADFYGRCAAYPEISRLLAANHVLVGPMSRGELRRAIELPAQRAGLRLEPGLVERLLDECEGEPGALPLLSTALLELWQQRDGRDLRLAGYERTAGVRGAVARLAEAAYERLDPQQQAVARRILLRLAGDDVHGAPVRRRVPLDELAGDRDDDLRRVLDVLTESRLVTVGEGTVEVAHEALLREWPRLRRWLDEDRDGRRLHRRLSEAAREWNEGGRDRGDLYRGARLATALEWRTEHESELNPTEQDFLDAGRAAGERARRRLRLVLAGVLVLLVLTAVTAVVALDQRGQAQAEARAAEGQRLGAEALSEGQLDRALLLARQGVALDDAPTTRDNLLAVLRRGPAAIGVMRGDGDALNAIALHPDGRTLAVGDNDGTITFFDAASRRPLGTPHQIEGASRISTLAFSPDGTRLASAGWNPGGAVVDLFDARARRHITEVAGMPTAAQASVHFSPDSRVLAAQDADADRVASAVPHWDARTGAGRRLPQSEALLGHSSTLLGFVGSGARIVTTSEDDRATVIRDSVTLRSLRRFPAFGFVATLSLEAGLVALGARDGRVRLLDLRTGELRTARGRHDTAVVRMRFNRGGDRLVTAGSDERLIVWDTGHASALETLEARGIGPIQDLEVARDGRTAYSAGRDGTVIVWDLTGERRWERPFGTAGTPAVPGSLSTAADGSRFAVVVEEGGSVELFDGHTLRLSGRIRPAGGRVTRAAIAPDGATLAITTNDGRLELWDTRTRRPLGRPQIAHAHPARAVTFSADGRWLATGGDEPIVRLWDVRNRAPANNVVLGHVADLSLSPDGKTLAATHLDKNFSGGLEIRSVPSLRLLRTVAVPPGSLGRFSRDGRSLIYGDRDGRVWTLDTRSWRPRGRPLSTPPFVLTADLSPDGRLLATTSTDGTGRLWDVRSGRPIGATLSGESGDPIGAAFIGNGNHLAVMHVRGGVAWDVRPSSWARHACAVAGRTFTRAEWETALPQRDYAPACTPR